MKIGLWDVKGMVSVYYVKDPGHLFQTSEYLTCQILYVNMEVKILL